jgi:wobble nucleotide-excising tRNase
MITKITIARVNSYKEPTDLITDKKVNLIYGLNGTGKSTLSNYLYDRQQSCYSKCCIECQSDEEIFVYNKSFIKENFYESDTLKGIFTLSKRNKEAEEKIQSARIEIDKYKNDKASKKESIGQCRKELTEKKRKVEDMIWEIKTKNSNDIFVKDCLTGYNTKDKLLTHILSINAPSEEPQKTKADLRKEFEILKGNETQKYNALPKITYDFEQIESNGLFSKAIVGNENSIVAELIQKLGNSDWVKKGLDYIPQKIEDTVQTCPFCQEKTITKRLIEDIQVYFDETYSNNIENLTKLLSDYEFGITSVPKKEILQSNPFIDEEKKIVFENLYNSVVYLLTGNLERIKSKLQTPSQEITLVGTSDKINSLNQFIDKINVIIKDHNDKINNRTSSLNNIKKQFWLIMRWHYAQPLSSYEREKRDIEKRLKDLEVNLGKVEEQILNQQKIVREEQEKTENIDKAISNINRELIQLGIDNFSIKKHSDVLYKITRTEECKDIFDTLSEGEKTIITFLYFMELCKGKRSTSSNIEKKIIVIDDPISSLSHIYTFNIGQLIKNEFLKSAGYEQIFILTHSLYFFYELTEIKEEKRKNMQKLFRIIKNCDGSYISDMKYEEIQNDYHSYWSIINRNDSPGALIANCMRNIVEYFFNFVEKADYNNVFQKPVLQETRYQAFKRYMHRESHSLGQNIFDLKEFNYNDFKDAFRLVFTENGYEKHYNKMSRL